MPECVQNIPECERAYPQVWSNVVRQELVGGHRKGLLLCKLLLPKILPFVIIIHPSIIILPMIIIFVIIIRLISIGGIIVGVVVISHRTKIRKLGSSVSYIKFTIYARTTDTKGPCFD